MNIMKRCRIIGHGEPIILAHGMGGPIVWEPISEILSQYFKVIIPIFPGYGAEDGYIDYKDDTYVAFLERLRKELGHQQLNLVGLSMGGRTVINYTIDHPDKVSKLIIIDGVGMGNMSPAFSIPIIKKIFPWVLPILLKNPKNMEKLGTEDFVNKESEIYKRSIVSFNTLMSHDNIRVNFANILVRVGAANPRWKSQLPSLKIPTLILWAKEDQTAPIKWAYELKGLIKDSQLQVLEHYRHMAIMEEPKYFAERITKFLL